MFEKLNVTCTERTKRKHLHDFILAAYDRIENFWSGNEARPVINRKEILNISETAYQVCDANFKPDEVFYSSMAFHLHTGYLTFFFYPYPDTVQTGVNSFPDFSKPITVYQGKYVL